MPRMSSSSTDNRRVAAFGLFAALASSFGQTFFIGLFGGQLRFEYGLSEDSFGALYGGATLASGLLMFWLGGIADRHAMRNAVTFALGLLAAGCGLMASGAGVVALAAALFLLRLGGQGLLGHLAVVAAARGEAARRGRTVAWAALGFIIGEAVLPFGATGLAVVLDWRWVWWLAAAVSLGLCVPLLRGLAGDMVPPDRQPSSANEPAGWRRRDLLRNPAFVAVLSVVLVPAFVVTAVFFHQSSLGEARNWAPWQVAGAFAVFAAFQALATMGTGRLVDRFGSPALLRFVLLPLAVGALALGLLVGPAGLFVLFAGLGATAGGNAVVAGAVWAELFGTRHLGRVRGVYAALMVLSSAASPPLLGWALAAGLPLTALCLAIAAYAMIMPQLAHRVPGGRRIASGNGGGAA